MPKKQLSLLDAPVQKMIRAVWKAGKRKVTINGRVFVLSRQVVRARYETTTTPAPVAADKITKKVSRNETWIVVKPEAGGLPCANIELKPMGNLRASINGT